MKEDQEGQGFSAIVRDVLQGNFPIFSGGREIWPNKVNNTTRDKGEVH